jgi:BirA family transcriptional regulator, biotin operon repressor / biotin---[acetyl-CoA-carboxylase] ligase
VTVDQPERPPIDRAALAALDPLWRTIEVVEESPSTNAVVAARARSGEREGLVVVAEHQTTGRGRLDRAWVTPPRAALTFSMLLTPVRVPASQWPWLPLLAGVGTVEGVRRGAGVTCGLKWPNDVLVGERKVAGILVERIERQAGPAAVIGIGLNVSSVRAELPVPTASSLALEGATSLDRSALLVAVLNEVAAAYTSWRDAASVGGSTSLPASYALLCSTIGRRVRVELPGGEQLTGDAVGVDLGGRLKVSTEGGLRVLGAGDVVHLRMA